MEINGNTFFFKNIFVTVLILSALSLIAVNFLEPAYIFYFDLFILAVALFIEYPLFGLYLMILFYPFVNWQFSIGSMNLPYVDLAAMTLFLAVFLKRAFEIATGRANFKNLVKENFPGLLFAGLFFAAAGIAVFHNEFFFPAAKYLLRPIIFFYLMFVILPCHLIRDKKVFRRALICFLVAGLAVAGIGLLSVVFPQGANLNLHRAVPYSFGAFNPLGGNQNAIAEIMTAAIPVAFMLFLLSEKIKQRGWYILAAMLFVIILLLTFSRSGWLALMVELLVLFFVQHKHKIDKYVVAGVLLTLVLVGTVLYFSVWQNVDWVRSSNANRALLTKISFDSFLAHPFIGNGLNTFKDIVGRTFVFTVEFGDPLDSHGFAQKLLTETGLLGFAAFMLFLGYIFKQYWQGLLIISDHQHKMIRLSLLMIFCGLVVFELFSTSYFLAAMWLPIGVGLAGAKFFT